MTLDADISGWDGQSRDDILAVHAAHSQRANYTYDLTRAAQQTALADGATWLLKHASEQGAKIADPIGVIRAGARAQSWPAQLHVLQLLPELGIPKGGINYATTLVTQAVASPKSMLRAWGYTGCDLLAQNHETLRPRMQAILDKAREEETSAAVLARLELCSL